MKQPTFEEIKELAEDMESLKGQKSELKGKMDEIEAQLIELGYKNIKDATKKLTALDQEIGEKEEQLRKDYAVFKQKYEGLL